MDTQSEIKDKCDFIYNQIKTCLAYYITPILILPSIRCHQIKDIIANGTGTLIKLNEKFLLVTCYHVWDAFRQMRTIKPETSIVLFTGDCMALELSSIKPLSENKEKDLIIIDISQFVKNGQIGVKKFIIPEIWPYKRPMVGDVIFFLGYPGQLRQPEKSIINIAWYLDFIQNLSGNSITLRGKHDKYIEDYYDDSLPKLTDFGGCSGCPVFVCREDNFNKLELIGIMYEGHNEIFGEKVRDILITYSDFIDIDGLIN